MKIVISNSSKQPIYEQITYQIKEEIIKGLLTENTVLPSIRNLAKELGVSVITTKRAYEELEREGYIHTIPGKGTFVASQNIDDIKDKKNKMIEEDLIRIIEECKVFKISRDELIEMINILYE
ncbi:MAG: GntR family transcriptional regulator [Tissierellia bacterium]|nr:GntR family transcriptional regulator [Tissierellia bacterium]MDD4780921.1 GntR family transcriptional regulator [Tissierellia bacterium]